MEKPVKHKEKHTKISITESEEFSSKKPIVQIRYEENQTETARKESKLAANAKAALVWDCGSSLYDSFELKSFERQLDSAIHSRTLSMPRYLSDRRVIDHHHPPQFQPEQPMSKKSSKFSRSFHKLIQSVFKPKAQNGKNPFFPVKNHKSQDGFYVDSERSGVLSTIQEVTEFDGLSPAIKPFIRRSASDRFTVNSIGISCA